MKRTSIFASFFVLVALGSTAAWVTADEVQLVNGDTVKGRVVSLDEKQIKIKSDILGDLTIERKNVRVIQLYDDVVGSSYTTPPGALRSPNSNPAPDLLPGATPPAPAGKKTSSIDDVLKQLRKDGTGAIDAEALLKKFEAEGGNADAIAELKKNMPLFGAPKVQGYVEKQLKGLVDGSIQIDDIRRDAIRARDETRKAIKDLGPGAEDALAPYLGILDKFIEETAPAKGSAKPK